MQIIKSHAIYTESGIVDGYLVLKDKQIDRIIDKRGELPEGSIIDYGYHRILPGIIDLHTHGYRSFAARTLHFEECLGFARVMPSIGVTSFLPTVCGWKEHQIEMIEAVSNAIAVQKQGARMLGIHMEGPYFHPSRHNATPLSELKEPSIKEFEDCLNASKGYLRYVTLAPELPHAQEVIKWLDEHHIIAGGGHTTADYEQFSDAKANGMRVSIHTGNAMNQMDRREIGLLGGALADPDMYCEINCDLVHLSKEMLEIMFRIKQNYERFIMISDSDTVSGIEPGYYLVGNQRTRVTKDGRMLLDDGTIAGSCRNILYGIRNLAEEFHIPLTDILKMSSLNAARLLKIDDHKGSILEGKDADLVIVDEAYEVLETYVEGQSVYQANDELPSNPRFCEEVPIIFEKEGAI